MNTKVCFPKDWEMSTLRKIGKYINGFPFKPSDWRKRGVPIIRIQNLTNKSRSFNYYDKPFEKKYEINKNDLLISWSATLDIFKWDRRSAVLNQHIFKVILNKNIDRDFFYYVVKVRIKDMKKRIHGTTLQHITKDAFLDIPIALPPPNSLSGSLEQQKIGSILASVDPTLDQTKMIIEKNQRMKIGLVQRHLTSVAKPYTEKQLDKFIITTKNGFTGEPNNKSIGLPRLGISSISESDSFYVSENIHRFIKIDKSELDAYLVQKNDLLLCRQNGNKELVGKIRVYGGLIHPIIFSDSLILIRVKTDEIIPEYLTMFLSSISGRKQIGKFVTTTAGNYSVNSTNLKKLKIPVPPLPEQKKIVSILISLDNKILTEKQNYEKLSKLQKGLMEDLLTPTLRVNI